MNDVYGVTGTAARGSGKPEGSTGGGDDGLLNNGEPGG